MRSLVGASSVVVLMASGTLILSATSCAKSSFKPVCNEQQKATPTRVSLSATATEADTKTGERIIRRGTKVSASLRDSCEPTGPISSTIDGRFEGETRAGVRSYVWEIPRDMTLSELEAWAVSDACVSLISDYAVDVIADDIPESMNLVGPLSMPNDPMTEFRRHLEALNAPAAYDIFYDRQKGITSEVVVAVVDSGVEIRHEDLRQSLWVNRGEIPGNGIDDDRNGYVDDINGYNFASRKGSPLPEPGKNGSSWTHGTKVAGLAAATGNNGIGVSGVIANAKIMSLNNMGTDSGMAQIDTANAIRYAVDNGADVINLSIGSFTAAGADYREALEYAVRKGVVVMAAAGNGNYRINSTYSAAGQAPRLNGLVSVGNFLASSYRKTGTSNYNPNFVEFSAPGQYDADTLLFTTYPTNTSSYGGFSGTSAATPVASGAVALAIGLIKSRGYDYTAADIERLLLDSAKKTPALATYFKDGNALDLERLAVLTDQRYPQKTSTDGNPVTPGTKLPATEEPSPVSKEGVAAECAAL